MAGTSRSPLTGSRAYRLFKWSAIWMGLVVTFLALIVPLHDRIESNDIARLAFRVAGGCLGVVGAFAAFIIFFGMLIYLFRYDTSATKTKILWLVLFLATAWFGSSIYFWAVYRRQVHQAAWL
jgi:hypothetical protein